MLRLPLPCHRAMMPPPSHADAPVHRVISKRCSVMCHRIINVTITLNMDAVRIFRNLTLDFGRFGSLSQYVGSVNAPPTAAAVLFSHPLLALIRNTHTHTHTTRWRRGVLPADGRCWKLKRLVNMQIERRVG